MEPLPNYQSNFLSKANLKQIPDISEDVCDENNFSIYDNYEEISYENKSKAAPTVKSSVKKQKVMKEMSSREKALMFAKNVPKPKVQAVPKK